MSQLPPPWPSTPGWHRDPENPAMLRWWDGYQWTANRHPVQPPSAPLPPYPTGRKPKSSNRALWITLASVFGGLLIVGLIASAFGVGDESSGSASDTTKEVAEARSPEDLEFRAQVACATMVDRMARNPDSVDFRGVTVVSPPVLSGVWIVTGQVNAENALGGMTGFQPYRCEATWNQYTEEMNPKVTAPAS
ncbi:DUF2510 domain-containing protein [Gordonia hongkongensis]|uniref:DUF2510 domain-containing protein n=1 Tax=Gordonia hongkongensis TaxID=1701090 RepID=UPI003D74E105